MQQLHLFNIFEFVSANRSRMQVRESVGGYDEPDNSISPAGHLMRTELNDDSNNVLDLVDFEVSPKTNILGLLVYQTW